MTAHEKSLASSSDLAPHKRLVRPRQHRRAMRQATRSRCASQHAQRDAALIALAVADRTAWGEDTAGRFPSLGSSGEHRLVGRSRGLALLTAVTAGALLSAPTTARSTASPNPASHVARAAPGRSARGQTSSRYRLQPSLSSLIIPRDSFWSPDLPRQSPAPNASDRLAEERQAFFGSGSLGLRPVLVVTLRRSAPLNTAALLHVASTTLLPVATHDSRPRWMRLAGTFAVSETFTYRSSFQHLHQPVTRNALPGDTMPSASTLRDRLLQGQLVVASAHGLLVIAVLAVRASQLTAAHSALMSWLAHWRWKPKRRP